MKSFVGLFGLSALLAVAAGSNIFCYYEGWVATRPDDSKFTPNNIDANLCTHVTYAFIVPSWDANVATFSDEATLRALVALRNRNQKLKKVLVSIGGWTAGSPVFSNAVGTADNRKKFINSIANFLNQYNLDGIDIDWEYPAAFDNANYITFLRELRSKLGTGKLITAAVGAGQYLIGTSYNVPAMNQYLDLINLMTYDFHTYEGGNLGQNAPLYENSALNVDAAIQAWIKAGASTNKLMLGLGLYGRNFQLSNNGQTKIGSSSRGPGKAGPYTQQAGYLTYLEICSNLKQGGWTTVYDKSQQVPYSFKGDQWIGYDNVQSLKAKAEYAKNKKLAGAFVWAVDMDDFNNRCGGGNFPLMKAINSVL